MKNRNKNYPLYETTVFEDFRVKGRGGLGVTCHNLTEKTGLLAGIATVGEKDDIMIITDEGTIIRTPVEGIPVYEGNNTAGVIIMRLAENSRIISFAATRSAEEEEAEIEASLENSEVFEAKEVSFPIADEDEI